MTFDLKTIKTMRSQQQVYSFKNSQPGMYRYQGSYDLIWLIANKTHECRALYSLAGQMFTRLGFNALSCALICDYGLVSSPHSLSILLLFVDACSESGSKEQLRSYTNHNCEQKHHKINDNTRVGCCSTGMDRHIQQHNLPGCQSTCKVADYGQACSCLLHKASVQPHSPYRVCSIGKKTR